MPEPWPPEYNSLPSGSGRDHQPVAPAALGSIQRGVRPNHDLLDRTIGRHLGRQTDTDGYRDLAVARRDWRLRHAPSQTLGHSFRHLQRRVGQHDREFLATQPAQQVDLPNPGAQHGDKVLQGMIAAGMAVTIVYPT